MPHAPDLHLTRLRPAARVMRLGFLPLFDAAPLLVADALGIFEAVGLRVALSPEASWAALRDKLAFSALDGAQMLGPMPIALAAGLGGVEARLQVACGLSQNGNGITLSNVLAEPGDLATALDGAQMLGPMPIALAAGLGGVEARLQVACGLSQNGNGITLSNILAEAGDLATALKSRAVPATFAVVFPFSSHNYLLRRWLLAQGIDPERDVRFTVVPPPRMATQLLDGQIDGFCAGAPWGAAAEAVGAGRVVAGTADIWPNHPEKVLAFSEDYLADHREQAIAATSAIIAAARWLDDPANRDEALRILSERALWQLSRATIESAFDATHRIRFRPATLPRRSQAAVWLGAMREAGHVPDSLPDAAALAPFGDALWHAAAARVNEPEPTLSPDLEPIP